MHNSLLILKAVATLKVSDSRSTLWGEKVAAMQDLYIAALKMMMNERGHLMEVQRRDDERFPGFGQAYVTCTLPGIIKAWYRHQQQIDQITLIKGALLLTVYDSRQHSQTYSEVLEISMTEQAPLLVQIPPGIWHGFKSVGREPAYLLHLNSIAFNVDAVDEDRLPANSPLIPYTW